MGDTGPKNSMLSNVSKRRILSWSPERSVKGVREKGYICWRKTNFPWKAHQNSQTNYIIVSISEGLKKKVAFCSWNLNIVQEPQACRKVWEARVHLSRSWLTCRPQWRPLFSPLSHTLPDPAWLGLTKKWGHGSPEHPKKSWYTFPLWLCLNTETWSENHKRDWKARKIWVFPWWTFLRMFLRMPSDKGGAVFWEMCSRGDHTWWNRNWVPSVLPDKPGNYTQFTCSFNPWLLGPGSSLQGLILTGLLLSMVNSILGCLCWSSLALCSTECACFPVIQKGFLDSFRHPGWAHIKCIRRGRSVEEEFSAVLEGQSCMAVLHSPGHGAPGIVLDPFTSGITC